MSIIKNIIIALLVILSTSPGYAAKLHSILIGDTADTGIGAFTDIRNMKRQIQTIERMTGMTVREKNLSGKTFTIKDSLNALKKLNIGNDDVVIFYYSGHGYRTENKDPISPWPVLFFSWEEDGMSLDTAVDIIKSKNPRLTIIMADCCNSYLPETLAPLFKVGAKAVPDLSTMVDNYKKLFLKTSGLIIVASSEVGEYSYGNRIEGGLYTTAWLSSLRDEVTSDEEPSWEHIFATSIKNIHKDIESYNKTFPDDQITQMPIYSLEIK